LSEAQVNRVCEVFTRLLQTRRSPAGVSHSS
jgi:hypothetical protein